MYRRLTAYLIIFFSSLSFANQTLPDKVKLSTKLWPPYHFYNDNGDLVGISVKVLQCSFKKLNINLEIEVVPWSRAQQHTQIGISDGFFSASWNAARDKYASRSTDIAPQNWVWYTLKAFEMDPRTDAFKQKAKVVGTRGSNIIHWLKKNNYAISAETTDLDSMVNMISNGRADAFMANELVAINGLTGKVNLDSFKTTIARSMPVGVYYNHRFLQKYPSFLSDFNQSIKMCKVPN